MTMRLGISMKILLLIVIFAFYTHGQDSSSTILFSPTQLKDDLNYLFDNLEQIHPDLYHYTAKSDIDVLRREINDSLLEPMTRLDYALKIIPLVTALNDGHTGILLPREERSVALNKGLKIFPILVKIIDGSVYTKTNLSSDSSIVIGSEIEAINGTSVELILNRMRAYYSAELGHFRDIRVAGGFHRLLWYLYGPHDNFVLEVKNNGRSDTLNLRGITASEFDAAISNRSHRKTVEPFHFYKTHDNSAGVIEFNIMYKKSQFRKFLDSTFAVMKSDSIQNLIVDIRKNGGGNSDLIHDLFDYITDKPYKIFDTTKVKVSKGAKDYVKRNIKWYFYPLAYPVALFVPQARPYFYMKNGLLSTVTVEKIRKPKVKKAKFKGETFLLTSHYTFSSANALANSFKSYNLGTIIGEETGGVLTAYGDIIRFQLPNTKIDGYCSHKVFIHANSKNLMQGVLPDIPIHQSIDARDMTVDDVMHLIDERASE